MEEISQMKCAIYARYSTDGQREQSIEDQFRVCEKLAERHGFTVSARFSDKAISGGTTQRPGYQEMLRAARRNEFSVIVAEDTSRLWRNLAEQSPRLAELSDLGIQVVTHDLDTRHESAEIMGAVGGAMASAYRKEIGRRTRRGLEGVARSGKPTGRAVYGYTPASKSATKEFEVNLDQAVIVHKIFVLFVDGYSPRAIANILNQQGVPSPRAKSKTAKQHRMLGWRGSVIKGHRHSQAGILNNELYRGEVIWGRTKWVRSAADSSIRTKRMVPESEWIRHTDENLRIISEELWTAAKERQDSTWKRIGKRMSIGMSKDAANRTGAGPKFLFSGLLECRQCGSNYVICGRDIYGCAGNKNGGSTMCSNDARVRRHALEEEALRGIKKQLLSPEAIDEICRQVRVLLKKPQTPAADYHAQMKALRVQIDNLTDAIASGHMRASQALGNRLMAAEQELERLERAQEDVEADARAPERLYADLRGRVTQAVESLQETLATGDVTRSRQEIEDHVGRITVEADEQEIRLYSNKMHLISKFLRLGNVRANLCGSGGRI